MNQRRTARSAALGSVFGAVAARYALDSAVGRSSSLEVFADYALMMTLGALVGAVAPLGLPEIGNRVVAELDRERRYAKLRSYVGLSSVLAVGLGVALAALVGLIMQVSSEESAMLTLALCVVAPSIALLTVRRAQALQLHGGNLVLFAPALSSGTSAVALVVLWFSAAEVTVLPVAACVAGGNLVVALLVCRVSVPPAAPADERPTRDAWLSWLRQGGHAVSNAVASLLLTQGDIIVVSIVAGARAAGAYAAASRLAMVVTMALGGLIPREAPVLGRLVATGDLLGAWKQYRQASVLSGVAGGMICAALVIGGGPILELFVPGAGLAAGWLAILAIGRLGSAVVGPAAELLIALNAQRLAALSSWVGVVVAAVLMLTLGLWLGPWGVAIGTTTGMLVRSFLHRYLAGRRCLAAQQRG